MNPARWNFRRASHVPAGGAAARHCAAFSLIEVLVVVAIIAMLAAVLLPGLSRARQQAATVQCNSNLRQLAAGWLLFLNDNKGAFPQGINMDLKYGGKAGIRSGFGNAKPLNRYVGLSPQVLSGGEVFECPAEPIKPTIFEQYGTSYRANLMMIGQDTIFVSNRSPCRDVLNQVNPRIKGIRRDQVDNESRLVLMGDYPWVYQWYETFNEQPSWHGRRCTFNVAFMDGHAKSTLIRKGGHTGADYTVIPFGDLAAAASACQQVAECQ